MDYLWKARGFAPEVHLAHRIESPDGLSIGSRIIEDFELVLFTRGSGDYLLAGETIEYRAPALIVTCPYQRHAYRSAGIASAHYALHFDTAPLHARTYRSSDAVPRPDSLRYLDEGSGIETAIPFYLEGVSGRLEPRFKELILRHREARLRESAAAALHLAALTAEILALVVEEAAAARTSRSGGPAERLGRAAYAMDTRYGEDLPVSVLAAEAGYAPNYFSCEFRRSYGIAPMGYLRERRLTAAMELLRTTELPVKEVARRCGFDDALYFSKAFRKRTGLSPVGYRTLSLPSSGTPGA